MQSLDTMYYIAKLYNGAMTRRKEKKYPNKFNNYFVDVGPNLASNIPQNILNHKEFSLLESWKKLMTKRQKTALFLTPQAMYNQFKRSSAGIVSELYYIYRKT